MCWTGAAGNVQQQQQQLQQRRNSAGRKVVEFDDGAPTRERGSSGGGLRRTQTTTDTSMSNLLPPKILKVTRMSHLSAAGGNVAGSVGSNNSHKESNIKESNIDFNTSTSFGSYNQLFESIKKEIKKAYLSLSIESSVEDCFEKNIMLRGNVDLRRFVAFGLLNNLIRRVHNYPTAILNYFGEEGEIDDDSSEDKYAKKILTGKVNQSRINRLGSNIATNLVDELRKQMDGSVKDDDLAKMNKKPFSDLREMVERGGRFVVLDRFE